MKAVDLQSVIWQEANGYRKAILADERDLRKRGSLAQIVSVPPHGVIKPHYHKVTSEFIYVMSGRALFRINERVLELSRGDMIVTHPPDVHSVNNIGDVSFEVLVFKTNAARDDSFWK